MGKKVLAAADRGAKTTPATNSVFSTAVDFDPDLASLFASSSGPVQASRSRSTQAAPASKAEQSNQRNGATTAPQLGSDIDSDAESQPEHSPASPSSGSDETESSGSEKADGIPPRKRRKIHDSDNIEANYLARLSRVEVRESKTSPENAANSPSEDISTEESEDSGLGEIPMHESLASAAEPEAREVAKRTVFLGNVSVEAIKSKSAKKILLGHLSSILPDLPDQGRAHTIESIRFRSTAFADVGIPKKAAFVKKDLMESTTKSTNAYVVYSTEAATRKAARLLNGTIVLQRHLRVDHVAHPAPIDHKRCVFVGNLSFVDEEKDEGEDDDTNPKLRKKKPKTAGDAEEGLWQVFSAAGRVESVRIPRDKATRVSKGFAYVQFQDENAVESALIKFHDKKFPPLLPRKLRVTRAKKINKSLRRDRAATRDEQDKRTRVKQGRAKGEKLRSRSAKSLIGIKRPEAFVFEGHRASSNSGAKLKSRSKKSSGKRPANRSARRGAAFKAAGGRRKRAA